MSSKKITEELTDHHEEIRKLMKASEKDNEKFIFLKKHLDIHHELEEDFFLEFLNSKKTIKDESLESQEEHLVLNLLLLDLDDFPKDNPRWKVKLKVFGEFLEHHLSEEEEDLFPEAEEIMSDKKLIELGEKFNELKDKRLKLSLKSK